ncbi:NUDIX hydrolase [Zhihengliuella sp.]|uniref:NUDIX hydrolase n=1 Tax=Zhihengliuella sp. TaxID=1954483 RepID=UPI0028123C82|nr:NUDIX hydrolase [Zhihengliuella sp.]
MTQSGSGEPAQPEGLPALDGDAATAVLLRDGEAGLEVLLLERLGSSRTFAGAWVFPGGFVDPEDYLGAEDSEGSSDPELTALADGARNRTVPDLPVVAVPTALIQAARRAAVRETAEETGLLIDEATLVPTSCWVPPRQQARRMRAWYFLAPLRGAASDAVVLSPDEHADSVWITPQEALDRHEAGTMVLVPPLWLTLHLLREYATVDGAVAGLAADPPVQYRSQMVQEGGRKYVVWEGDAAWIDEHPAEPDAEADAAAGMDLELVEPNRRFRLDVTEPPWTLDQH